MKIAVLSGKGGTGKTFVSVNLSAAIDKAVYVDCDVEAPNGTLFYQPENVRKEDVFVTIPSFDHELCTGCKKCVEFCNFNALAYVSNQVMLFPEVCHSCGGCYLVCPSGVVTEHDKVVGSMECGTSGNVTFLAGTMKIGEVTGVPIIKAMLKKLEKKEIEAFSTEPIIIDCPPGSGCMVMESIVDADYCILVAEPTAFGAHNLEMVYELVKVYNKPFGVVLNKCVEDVNPSEEFCIANNAPIIGRIPFDEKIGEMNAQGIIIARESTNYAGIFLDIFRTIKEGVGA